MKRILCLSALTLVGLASSALGGGHLACLNCGIHCICPPEECPDCSNPCDRWFHHCSCRKSEQARKFIDQLSGECCCDRIKAAHHLGSRLHADFCCDPEVLTALVHALNATRAGKSVPPRPGASPIKAHARIRASWPSTWQACLTRTTWCATRRTTRWVYSWSAGVPASKMSSPPRTRWPSSSRANTDRADRIVRSCLIPANPSTAPIPHLCPRGSPRRSRRLCPRARLFCQRRRLEMCQPRIDQGRDRDSQEAMDRAVLSRGAAAVDSQVA